MFAKRTILVSLVVAAFAMMLPNLSFAQTYYEEYNDMGDACGYASFPTNGFIWATKMHPPYARFKIDSVKFAVYRYTGATATFTFKIRLYEDTLMTVTSTGCPGGAVQCPGPGLQRWASTNMVTPGMVVGNWYWFTFNVPDCTFYRDFIIGVEIAQTTVEPSLMMDCTVGGPPCCYNYYKYGTTWYEHWDLWAGPQNIGYNMIRCKGTGYDPLPGELTLSTHSLWFGHVDISYGGGTEYVNDSLSFTNSGGNSLTISSVTTTAPLNFIFNAAEVTGALAAGQTKWLHIDFTTTTPEPTLTAGNLVVTHTGGNGPTDTCRTSGKGFGGHWIENFIPYPEPIPGPATSGDWWVRQYQCTTAASNSNWGIYIDFGWANQSALHYWTATGCYAEDLLFTSPIDIPGNSVKVRWGNYNYYNEDYYFSGLYWSSPNDTLFHFHSEISPTTAGEWTEVGPYYVVSDSDSVMLGFLYAGEYAHNWALDDIRVDSLPPSPPILTHEHHSDDGPATWINPNCVHITVQALDPNNDLSYVRLWYKDLAGGNWTSVAMTAVTGCEYMNLYEATICGLVACHAYGYYFEANDVASTGPTYLPVGAPASFFNIDIMDNTTPQLFYDSGTTYYVQYFFDYVGAFAVRFTPVSYPYALGGAMVMIGTPYQSFPDADHEDVTMVVYNAGGVGGLPGNVLYGPVSGGTSWNEGAGACDDTTFAKWVYFKIEPCVTITSGDFYISFRNRDNSVSPDMDAFGFDNDGPSTPYRSYCFYPTGGGGGFWGLDTLTDPNEDPASDFMCRALECSCVPVPPTNVTVIYNAGTSNVELRWVDQAPNLSYKIYRSTTDPFSGFTLLATRAPGVQFYADPLAANTKAFYRIQGSCDAPAMAPYIPPSEPVTMVGPVRIPGAGRTAALAVGQQWSVVDQLEIGALPKTISKSELAKLAKTRVSPTKRLLDQFAK
ncbi:MAG: hypothetical protein V1784_09650 [bacterium]